MDMRTIWVPSGAEERGYYDRLFQLADVSNTGKLAGQSAVLFLARSGLSFPILKQVNTAAKEKGKRRNHMVMLRVWSKSHVANVEFVTNALGFLHNRSLLATKNAPR